jgi:hypothetical protein
MEKENFQKETHKIFKAIAPRLDEMGKKIRDKEYTDAYATAFMIGLLADIDSIVVKMKHERKNNGTAKKNRA